MTVDNVSIYSPPASSLSEAEGSHSQERPLVTRLKSVSNENIAMASSSPSRKETIFDYPYQARKYFVENKQHDNIHLYDKMFLQDLINGEHKRKPGLNITLTSSPEKFASRVASLKMNSPVLYRGQFIVNMGEGVHYAALDVIIKDGNVSIIGIEPSNLDCRGPAMLLLRLLTQIEDKCPSARVVMMESNIQQSPVDCAIFSLHFALKMHTSKAVFDELHREHMDGSLSKNITDGFISKEHVDQYLPVEFMKHTNSRNRLCDYFIKNANIAHIAQKKDLTTERQKRFTFDRGERTYSASIEDKRIKLIERTIKVEVTGIKG